MGCCGSKQSDHDQNERARLLDESHDAHRYGGNRMTSSNYGEHNQIRELESLQRIVDRTAGILIDIPSTLHLDRLQHQEAQTRSNEYLSVLNTVKLPQQTIRKLYSMTSVTTSHNHSNGDLQVPDHDSVKRGSGSSASSGHSVKAASVRDVLAEKAIDAKTLGWMANAMGELHQATEQIDVEDVGDLIVTLSPPLAQ